MLNDPEKTLRCPSCHAERVPGARFCRECGLGFTNLESETLHFEPSQRTSAPATESASSVGATTRTVMATMVVTATATQRANVAATSQPAFGAGIGAGIGISAAAAAIGFLIMRISGTRKLNQPAELNGTTSQGAVIRDGHKQQGYAQLDDQRMVCEADARTERMELQA